MGPIHHLDLVVCDLDTSLAFYRGLLAPLGYERLSHITGERGEPVAYIGHLDGSALGLRAAPQGTRGALEQRHDRYAIGVHHLAFAVRSREVVDERAEWSVAHGASLESAPREYDYAPGYYAVFLRDPDDLKLELVHEPAGT